MKKFLALAILLIIPVAVCSQSIGGYYGPAPSSVTYALRCFSGTIDNQSYSNGQVIDTAGEGCTDGSFTCGSAASGFNSAVSNKWRIDDYTWPVLTKSCSTTVTRAFALGIFATIDGPSRYYSYNTIDSSPVQGEDGEYGVYLNNGVLQVSTTGIVLGTNTQGTPNKLVYVLGGYNSSGIPYKSGDTKSDFLYGSSMYFKSGSDSTLYLAWKRSTLNSSTANWRFDNLWDTTGKPLISNILIPVLDFSSVLQPTHLSLFATDGELSDYVPTVGTGWTEDSGDWDTASGVLKATAAGVATFAGGTPYVLFDGKITTPASGTAAASMVLKYADATHYWLAKITPGTAGTDFELIEVNGDGGTQRMSADVDWVAETAYNVRIISSSTSPYWSMFVNGVAKGTAYTTQGSSASATTFGLSDDGNANFTFDQIALWPRTSTTYDSQFAQVGY